MTNGVIIVSIGQCIRETVETFGVNIGKIICKSFILQRDFKTINVNPARESSYCDNVLFNFLFHVVSFNFGLSYRDVSYSLPHRKEFVTSFRYEF